MAGNVYERLFDSFLDLAEFTLIKYFDGWGLKDNQDGNLGNIEAERFRDSMSLIDSLDAYIEDYLVDPIERCLGVDSYGMTWGDFAIKHRGKAGESEYDLLMLDALCNHPEEIDLDNCNHEVFSEKIFTVISHSYSDGYSVTSFHRIEDARSLVKLDSEEAEELLKSQGYNHEKVESYLCTEIYVLNTDIYYEWFVEESELY